jgi:DNA-binding MarR family transcriptional regulator
VVSAKEVLEDLTQGLTDRELMRKHGLTKKGLTKMFDKLLHKGLITKRALADRFGVKTDEISVALKGEKPAKAVVNASEVLQDIADNMTDTQMMRKYKLSPKGLRSMMRKLYRRGLISDITLTRRKGLE